MYKRIQEVLAKRNFAQVFILDEKSFSFSEEHVQKHAHWYKKIEKLTPEQVAERALNENQPPKKIKKAKE